VVINANPRLIEALEQERLRIARELHDDIAQRLALLAINLAQLQHDTAPLPGLHGRVEDLKNLASEIAVDVQTISNRLHSSKLETLGLSVAMRGFCAEFGEQQQMKVDVEIHDLPNPLPPDISLCLFRILQEALHNSAKHSGGARFEVRSWATQNEVHLMVKDFGSGFDQRAAKSRPGLGLISMQERVKILNGTLSIGSPHDRGTTIHACVPFDPEVGGSRPTHETIQFAQ
jgi:signal transduction histidine kinase